ncbi:MAG: DUF3006 domain-containing protein [Angelakisella sp.]
MLIIDRLEGEYAVCEDSENEQQKKIPKVLLPSGVREGDCLIDEGGQWKINAAETLRRRKEAQKLLDKLYS